MALIVLCCIAVLQVYCLKIDLIVPHIWQNLHGVCLNHVQTSSNYLFIYRALLCGSQEIPTLFKDQFANLGLVHFFVVSGFHLQLLIASTRRLKLPKFVAPVLAVLLVVTCRFQAPVLRSALQSLCSVFNQRLRLYLSPSFLVLTSVAISLILLPSLADSSSLLLSWSAALIVLIPCRSTLLKVSLFYFALLPLLLTFHISHPLSIVVQALSGPFIAGVLIPSSFLSALIPQLQPLTDPLWEFLLKLTYELSQWMELEPVGYVKDNRLVQWVYVAALQATVSFYEQRDLLVFDFITRNSKPLGSIDA